MNGDLFIRPTSLEDIMMISMEIFIPRFSSVIHITLSGFRSSSFSARTWYLHWFIHIYLCKINYMGCLLKLLKKFSCKSSCMFNQEIMDMEIHKLSLDHFHLKYKDIEQIHKILRRRKRKNAHVEI